MPKITVTIGSFTQTYIICWTTAPAGYDGFGTITVYDDESSPNNRLVLIATEHFEWQTGRYRSGMYSVTEPDSCEVHEAERRAIERFTRLTG